MPPKMKEVCPCLVCEQMGLVTPPKSRIPGFGFLKSKSSSNICLSCDKSSSKDNANDVDATESTINESLSNCHIDSSSSSSSSSESFKMEDTAANSGDEGNPIRSRGGRPRMQRRCSVTKFSLETFPDAIDEGNPTMRQQQPQGRVVKTEETHTNNSSRPPVPPRRRLQRRCSVTKFNLDESVLSPTPKESDDFVLRKTQSLRFLNYKPEYEDDYDDIVPKRPTSFRAKLSWGRAA